MISVVAGATMYTSGYFGNSIRAYQIAGPLSIGVGILIYIIGCFVCCGKCLQFENALAHKSLKNKTTAALNHLAKEEVIKLVQTEQKVLEQFRRLSTAILDRRR